MTNHIEQLNPTSRFSNRVDNYSKYRPSYPVEIIDFLQQAIGLQKDWTVADIGSGTGIFSELLLRRGYKVLGIEPNKEMRGEAEKNLSCFEGFTSINARAEETFLPGDSVHLITVAQAFHWMDKGVTKKEFRRISKPGGFMAMIWNVRLMTTPFLNEFEELKLKFGTDYKATRMVNEKELAGFFDPKPMTRKNFNHGQVLDFESLKGQLLSSSYIPLEGESQQCMIKELKDIFNKFNENGFVKIEYQATVFVNA
ncbi:MAG: class I SAM-dependent methyltransferase [Ginsengibacter sp.]